MENDQFFGILYLHLKDLVHFNGGMDENTLVIGNTT